MVPEIKPNNTRVALLLRGIVSSLLFGIPKSHLMMWPYNTCDFCCWLIFGSRSTKQQVYGCGRYFHTYGGEFLERILFISALTIRSDLMLFQFAMAWWKSGRVDMSNYKEVRPTNKTYHAHAELLNEALFRWISSTNSMSRACNYTLKSVTKMSSNYLMFFAYFISVFYALSW